MKHQSTILFLLALFVSGLVFTLNQPRTTGNSQNTSMQTSLTHTIDHQISLPPFTLNGSQYLNTEGNQRVQLSQYNTSYTVGGDYGGNFSFSEDANGVIAHGWTGIYTRIIENYTTHHKVEEIDASSGGHLGAFNNNLNGQSHTEGIIEFWVLRTYFDVIANINLWNSTQTYAPISLYGNLNGWFAWSNVTVITLTNQTIVNEWIHFTIQFNCSTHSYNVSLNDISETDLLFYDYVQYPTNDVGEMNFLAENDDFMAYLYVDAVDYSWTHDYYLNRDMNYTDFWGSYTLYYSDGSYLSPIYFIPDGDVLNWTTTCNILGGTNIKLNIGISTDNISFMFAENPLDNAFEMNFTMSFFVQFCFNLSQAVNDTPVIFSFSLFYRFTITNQAPSIENITITHYILLSYNFSCTISDPDGNLLNLTIRNATDDSILASWTNEANNTLCSVLLSMPAYATEYSFYFEVTDGEDAISSENFTITTEAAPEPPEAIEPNFIALYSVLAICVIGVLGIAGKSRSKRE